MGLKAESGRIFSRQLVYATSRCPSLCESLYESLAAILAYLHHILHQGNMVVKITVVLLKEYLM
jgi:hypothetical protein